MSEHNRSAAARRADRKAELWLPFVANDTLGEPERSNVEQRVEASTRLQAELGFDRQLIAALGARSEAEPTPHPSQLQQLFERIDQSESHGGGRGGSGVMRSGATDPAQWHKVVGVPRAVFWIGNAAAVLLIAFALFAVAQWALNDGVPTTDPEFRTLTAPGVPAAQADLLVVFDDTTTTSEIQELLTRIGGRIVDGPSASGAYRVALPADRSQDEVNEALEMMRAFPRVMLVEPVARSRNE